MKHKIDKYINKRLAELNWQDKMLVENSNISKGQISKLKNGSVEKLYAETLYLLIDAFGDNFEEATLIIYPTLKNNKLKKYTTKPRNSFGTIMSKYEKSSNSLEEISSKTGISEGRLSELYFRKGALEGYELILIEKAIAKRPGELFKEMFGNK